MEEVGFERFMELGAKHSAEGDPERAIHYYNSALRLEPGSARAHMGLSKALAAKAEAGQPVFWVLAMDALRKAAAADPAAAGEAHALLIAAAVRSGRLGQLAAEYSEKLKADPENLEFKKRLKDVYVVSLLDNNLSVPQIAYRPIFLVKVFFDCVLLPLGSSIIVAANVMPKARPSLMIGVFIFVCYVAYRGLVWFLGRGRV